MCPAKLLFLFLRFINALNVFCLKLDYLAFVKNDHPLFRREIAAIRHMPHGTAAVYAEGVRNPDAERMAKFTRIIGMLLQTKVYLFWNESPIVSVEP
jgi:hypothetical protein